jgi:hypothetical protein
MKGAKKRIKFLKSPFRAERGVGEEDMMDWMEAVVGEGWVFSMSIQLRMRRKTMLSLTKKK